MNLACVAGWPNRYYLYTPKKSGRGYYVRNFLSHSVDYTFVRIQADRHARNLKSAVYKVAVSSRICDIFEVERGEEVHHRDVEELGGEARR